MSAVDAAGVLWRPFAEGLLEWPAHGDAPAALALRGRAEAVLPDAAAAQSLLCTQSFAPDAARLRAAGYRVVETEDADSVHGPFALVALLPPRQREESRALLAQAVRRCAPGGVVVAAQANDEGAKSGEADLKRLAGLDGSLSKQHCRVYWSRIDPARVDAALLQDWSALDAPRRIADARFPGGGFVSRPGVFAWDRVDAASALLAEHLPTDLAGRIADLGAGYGFLSAVLMQRCARIVALDVYEAEARALALARENLAAAPRANATADAPALAFHWHDVAAGLPHAGYDAIVTNPPFHALGRADRPDIGRAFLAAAADALRRGGRLWLVANRHLPYEDLLAARFATVRTHAQAAAFKVIEAVKP